MLLLLFFFSSFYAENTVSFISVFMLFSFSFPFFLRVWLCTLDYPITAPSKLFTALIVVSLLFLLLLTL